MVYDLGEMTDKEAEDMAKKLEVEGVVSELQVEETGFSSPVMFLRKRGGMGVMKVVDFMILIS